MFRSILTVVLIVLLIVGCWMLYKRVNSDHGLGSGNVYFSTSGSKDQATTYFGDKALEEVHPTPSRSDDPGTINTEPVPGYNADNGAPVSTAPTSTLNPQPLPPTQQPYTAEKPIDPQSYGERQPSSVQRYPQPKGRSSYSQSFDSQSFSPERTSTSGGDTFQANPPNGLAFSGDGKYQVYRQGELTYRFDTETGESCVLYASMEEWAKPLVYAHGCGSRGWRRNNPRKTAR